MSALSDERPRGRAVNDGMHPATLAIRLSDNILSIAENVLIGQGPSTNYVLDISFPTPEEHGPSFFVLQGTAGLTMLND